MNVTTVSYRRSATGPEGSLHVQRLAAARWADEEGVVIDEEVEEIGPWTRMSPGLASILARAEAGEPIRLVVDGLERVARSTSVWSSFAARAVACGMQVVCTKSGAMTPNVMRLLAASLDAVKDNRGEIRRSRRDGD